MTQRVVDDIDDRLAQAQAIAEHHQRLWRCLEGDDDVGVDRMVVEDLGNLRIVDQVVGMSIEDARRAVDGVAGMHAKWWGKADALAADGTTISLGDPIYPAVVPMVFAYAYVTGWRPSAARAALMSPASPSARPVSSNVSRTAAIFSASR